MIIGVLEYGEVKIYDSVQDALKEWGSYPDDVLGGGVIVFYDEKGNPMEPRISQKRKIINLLAVNDSGIDSLSLALYEAEKLFPNSHYATLDELRVKYLFTGGV